ncbi:pitrilysin family protein [Deinococcus sonorensis]|uniref:Pitrilysin family protein n=2 Tax=Deinococcus sonorensis TaxID=309891 RepID=A0AAU7UF85_9DEIO
MAPLTAPPSTVVQTLPNGLTVACEQRRGPGFAFDLRVPLGSAHDPHGQQGTASMVEEWLSKGAAGRDAHAFQDALDDLGLRRGGGVGAEGSRFTASGLTADLNTAMQLHADLLRRPHLPPDEVEVLLDLARQDLEGLHDSPADRLSLEARRLAFPPPEHGPYAGYAHPASGTLPGLEAITPESARAWWSRFGARGSIMSVVSDHEPQQVLELAQRHFGDWQPGEAEPVPLTFRAGQVTHIAEQSAQAHLSLYWRGVDPDSPDWLAWHLALGVLAGGSASRLFQSVREERGLAYSVGAGAQILAGQGFVSAYAGSTPERAAETLEVLLSELERLRRGVEEDEFVRAREGLVAGAVFGAESIRGRVAALTRDLTLFGRVRSVPELRAQIERITLESVNRFLDGWEPGEPNLVTLGLEQSGGRP